MAEIALKQADVKPVRGTKGLHLSLAGSLLVTGVRYWRARKHSSGQHVPVLKGPQKWIPGPVTPVGTVMGQTLTFSRPCRN